MEKITTMALAVFLSCISGIALADSGQADACRINGSIKPYFEYIELGSAGTFTAVGADAYLLWKHKAGFGLDAKTGTSGFYDIRPYLTLSVGASPLSAIIGYDTVSTGADYLDYGVRYAPSFGQWNFFTDIRNFSAVSSEAKDYLDAFFELTTPISKTLSAGIVTEIIHQWNGDSDMLLIGPIVYKKIGSMTLMLRGEFENNHSPTDSKDGINIRIGINIPF